MMHLTEQRHCGQHDLMVHTAIGKSHQIDLEIFWHVEWFALNVPKWDQSTT